MKSEMTQPAVETDDLQQRIPQGMVAEIDRLLEKHGRQAARQHKIVAHDTTTRRRVTLIRCFRELRGLGFKLQSVHNLQQRHIVILAGYWERRELSASTIANRISVLRVLSEWIGKKGMVQKSTDFVSEKRFVQRKQATTVDKSWAAQNVDEAALIAMVEAYDWRVGLQLKLMRTFALRLREAVMFKPLKADLGVCIRVREGTKGGRERIVAITTQEQRDLLEFAKSKVNYPRESISHPDKNLEQAIRRAYYVFERFGISKNGLGVTSHGLRHERLHEEYTNVTGAEPPVRAGGQVTIDARTHDLGRSAVSELAGHARLAISGAYIGARQMAPETAEEKANRLRLKELLAKDMGL